jgi:uncharacterized delta-60 repeat protein
MVRPATARAAAPRLDVIRDFTPGFTRRSVAVLPPTGGVFMTGLAKPGSVFAVGKFISDGRPDTSFGTGGLLLPPSVVKAGISSDDRLLVQPDGRILAAASLPPQTDKIFRIALVRLMPNGALDQSFNGDGTTFVSFAEAGSIPSVAGVLLRPDGRIVIVVSSAPTQLSVVQLLANGDLDREFGVEGRLHAMLPAERTKVHDAVVDGSGNLVVSGAAFRVDSEQDMFVARFRPDGSADQTFGFQGSVFVDFGRGIDVASKLLLQPDGTILLGGEAGQAPGVSVPALVRLSASGTVDRAFGTDGLVRLDLGKQPGTVRIGGLARLSDGRIALAGHFIVKSSATVPVPFARTPQPFVTVLGDGGAADPSFNAGKALFPADLPFSNVKLTVEPRDKLLILVSPAAVRIDTTVPKAAPLSLEIGATPNPAGSGPVRFLVTITNQSEAATGGVLRLRASKKVAVESSTLMKAEVSPIGVDVLGKVHAVPPGGTATLTLRTNATGFEQSIELSGSVVATDADGFSVTSAASMLVLTTRFAVI